MIQATGSLFDTTAPAIGHGVNTSGVMGAGVAALVRSRWPQLYPAYQAACHSGTLVPGGVFPWQTRGPGVRILYNLASQPKPGRYARLDLIAKSGAATLAHAGALGFDRVAIPRIGAGIGGLDWPSVEAVLKTVEAGTGVEWEVWTPRMAGG